MRFTEDLSDETVLRELGGRIAKWRLSQNLTQVELAAEAGIARITLARAEAGNGLTVVALLRILRALGMLENLEALIPAPPLSPIDQLELDGRQRQRASGPRAREDHQPPWEWGTP